MRARGPLKWAAFAVLGLILFGVFLLFSLPAAWMDRGLAHLSGNLLTLDRPAGSLWRGSGELVVRSAAPSSVATRIEWRINPLWLLAGRLQVRLQAAGSVEARATVRLAWRKLVLNELSADLPGELAGLFLPAAATIGAGGRLHVAADDFTLDAGGAHGNAELVWREAGARLIGLTNAGDYKLDLTGRGAVAEIRLTTLRGNLEIAGVGQWQVAGNGQVQITGTVVPRAREPQFEPLLQLLGGEREGDRYKFTHATQLPLPRFIRGQP
jgi:general secretion pathway protein N